MNDYRRVDFTLTPAGTDASDLLAQFLADAGYESFVEAPDGGLEAYVTAGAYDAAVLRQIIEEFPMAVRISFTSTLVEGRDWNVEWERNFFQPIVVDGRCVIHSSFHTDVPAAQYDITIDPKMAFGTGHHATTALMIRRLLSADVAGRRVTDVGTGSGILAILAAMLGASSVTAIEIDEFAWTNAVENIALNGVSSHVEAFLGDAGALAGVPPCDLLLANINRNIITADLPRYVAAMTAGAYAAFSGFYEADVPVVEEAARGAGLTPVDVIVQDSWASLLCVKGCVDKEK